MAITTLISSSILVGCAGLTAQDPTQLQAYLAEHHALERFNGAALVVDGGEVVYEGAFGVANADWQIANEVETKFRLASVSKQFTAMMTLLLVDEGKIDLGEPITRYLADYPAEIGEQVNVHHLLNHTSGIPNYTNRPGFMQQDAMRVHDLSEFIVEYCSDSLEFEPGAYFHYSNSGYAILAAIIEEVTGQSYATALRERIFEPLGMQNSGHDDQSAVLGNRAQGYYELLGKKRNARYLDASSFVGAGSLYSTVGDLWKWHRALNARELLSGELERKMFTPGQGDYGYGWFIDSKDDAPPVHWHGGIVSGFSTILMRSPELDRCIILLCNTSESATREIAQGIMQILDGKTPEAPGAKPDWTLARRILQDGIEAGFDEFSSIAQGIRDHRIEAGINVFAYRLMGLGRLDDAILLLQFNVQAFPESANAWDSLGEAYLQGRERQLAIDCYAKALALNPTSATARAALQEIDATHPLLLQEVAIDPFKDWPSEVLSMPPSFAPSLPIGTESLRFAPGWRNSDSDEFWSYGFVMWMDEPMPDIARIEELLDDYFDGLMARFSRGKEAELGDDSVQVEVTRIAPGEFKAVMHLIDAFATFEPMDIRVRVSSSTDSLDRTTLRVRLSPQPDGHPIWESLEAAVAAIRRP